AGRDFSRRVSGSIADRRFIFFFKQKTAYEIFHVTGVQTCALPIFGIGGIAIGLAAQGIFSDLFAALSILFDKPFRVGEVITYDEIGRASCRERVDVSGVGAADKGR